jgi:hypothetical protein
MSDYLDWAERTRHLPLTFPAAKLESANTIHVGTLPDESMVLLKIIRSDVVYIRRLKVLGEAAYSLLDYHLNPAERVTPNVCPVSGSVLWREFIQGLPGEIWRGNLYKIKQNLDLADLEIVEKILSSRAAQRIALLDLIFLCQDRSARNWIVDEHGRFWAVDNGMFWAYKGRYADKETVRTGKVDHLNHPMDTLISTGGGKFSFQGGVFSSLYAERQINDGLVAWLSQIDWQEYLQDLRRLIGVLGYPYNLMDDWRFATMRMRLNWLMRERRFPTADEATGDEWQRLIDRPDGSEEVWRLEWETENLETE